MRSLSRTQKLALILGVLGVLCATTGRSGFVQQHKPGLSVVLGGLGMMITFAGLALAIWGDLNVNIPQVPQADPDNWAGRRR